MAKLRARIAMIFLRLARDAMHPVDRPKAAIGTMSAGAVLAYKYDLF